MLEEVINEENYSTNNKKLKNQVTEPQKFRYNGTDSDQWITPSNSIILKNLKELNNKNMKVFNSFEILNNDDDINRLAIVTVISEVIDFDEVKYDHKTTNNVISKIDQHVAVYRDETISKDYYIAITHMSCLHQLI